MSSPSLGLALLATVGLAQAQNIKPTPIPKFEVASIKPCKIEPRHRGGTSSPGRLNTGCERLTDNYSHGIIQRAYVGFAGGKRNLNYLLITGGPNWIRSEMYDINAKAEGSPSIEMMEGPMLQALLEDRFKLKIHRETKEGDVYALTLLRDDSKLKRWQEEGGCALRPSVLPVDGEPQRVCQIRLSMGGPERTLVAEGSTIKEFTTYLRIALDRPIIDTTGLAGRFDIRLKFSTDLTTPVPLDKGAADGQQLIPDPTGATLFDALQKQLGLKLVRTTGPIEFLVIDHIERPSEN